MASEAPSDHYDETDVVEEVEDSDTDAPPPPKKMMNAAPADDDASAEGGKGFQAVLPYLGAIHAPSDAPETNYTRPDTALELEWVHGFRAFDSKSNLVVNTRGHFVYPVAGLVVVYNKVNEKQTFFRGHNDDVRCLAQNPTDKDWIATGQNATVVDGRATSPYVCVWNSTDFTQSFKLQFPNGSRAIRCVGFSPCGRYIAAAADDDKHTISVWDWQARREILSQNGDNNPIFQVRWNHVLTAPGVYEIVTVGTKHAFFHTFDSKSNSLKSKRVTLGGAFPTQTWNSVTFSEKGHTCLGGFDGTILICKQGTNGAASKAISVSPATGTAKAAKVFTLDTYQGGIVAGLSDKTVVIFDSKLAISKTLGFPDKITAVSVRNRDLIVGTQGAEVYEIKGALDAGVAAGSVKGRFEPVTSGHTSGELWALATFPDGRRVVTAGEDNSVRIWDIAAHKLLAKGVINPKAGLAPKVKKASTTSLYPQNQCARAVAVSPDGSQIAVATNDGSVTVYSSADLATIVHKDLNSTGQRQVTNQEGNWVQTMEYSPNGALLAVGTHGSVIAILDARHNYAVLSVIKSHHSFLTHMDWSEDGTELRSNDGAYELLFHSLEVPSQPKQITASSSLKNTKWATSNCVFAWGALGVIQEDGNAVNSVTRSPAGDLLATGDDHGSVNLYRFPATEKGVERIAHRGHSSHVTSVRFSPDGQYLFSTGGHDLGIFQFKLVPYQEDATGLAYEVK